MIREKKKKKKEKKKKKKKGGKPASNKGEKPKGKKNLEWTLIFVCREVPNQRVSLLITDLLSYFLFFFVTIIIITSMFALS